MARTKEKRWGSFSGPPDVVARHMEFPVDLNDDPGRPSVVLVPLSKIPQLIRSIQVRYAKATGTSAQIEALIDSLERGDGFEDTDRT